MRSLTASPREGELLAVHVTATAGFYVRALARDLGEALGCGAHLASLRRTRVGTFDVSGAIPLADAERLGRGIAARVLSPAEALAELPAVTVTAAGLKRALHGNSLGPEHLSNRWIPPAGQKATRVLDDQGTLVALAHARGGFLHPRLVLG